MVLNLTAAQVADRAGISAVTLRKLESGSGGTTTASLLAVLKALGLLDYVSDALDPLERDIGRARADRLTRQRARS